MSQHNVTTARPIKQAASEFLEVRRIAVTGVSRHADSHSGNAAYTRLRERGYDVFAVNPNADSVDGDPCFDNLSAVPGGVDAVVIATRPEHAAATVLECIDLDVRHVWMHHGPAASSVSPEAASLARDHGIEVIDGGCPLMFDPTADVGHKCMRAVLTLVGRVSRRV